MKSQHLRAIVASVAALALVAAAAPVLAQQGSLRGKIVDEAGKGVADAEVIFDFVGDYNRQLKTMTDKNGEWIRAGIPSNPGRWTITVKKGDLVGKLENVVVRIGEMTRVAEIVIAPPRAGGTTVKPPAGMSKEEIEKANKRQEELQKLFDATNAAVDAGNFDEALAGINKIILEVPNCAACYAKLGDVHMRKKDLAEAEQALLKSIEMDATKPGPYGALATIYNQQKKFDEATKMSEKANELSGATGGDPATVYNQGIIYWNAGKVAEAKAQFQKAISLDAKMADAHYWLGMCFVNEGTLPEAKAPFTEYMKLAPTGQYADQVKSLLAIIK
jgi:tetratricopeptide (TPR) repeat protein